MSPAPITWNRDAVLARVTIDDAGCWIWPRVKRDGYGFIRPRGRERGTTTHRFVYELLVGPIDAAIQLDHLCHTNDPTCPGGPACKHRACVNPAHLEPVTPKVNGSRGTRAKRTHCPQGHPYTGWNLIRYGGRRYCRECMYAHIRARRARGLA